MKSHQDITVEYSFNDEAWSAEIFDGDGTKIGATTGSPDLRTARSMALEVAKRRAVVSFKEWVRLDEIFTYFGN
jgi:hypothetical protein